MPYAGTMSYRRNFSSTTSIYSTERETVKTGCGFMLSVGEITWFVADGEQATVAPTTATVAPRLGATPTPNIASNPYRLQVCTPCIHTGVGILAT